MKEHDRNKSGTMSGQVIQVYDGRKWPVVFCDSLRVENGDSVHKVIQAVLSIPCIHEKKRRVSKYTVAIGTTHGHVQVFLRDSDLLLPAFQQCPADEKCLLLIKRPKESSRKLLKSQSLNNLSISNTQLYKLFDGTARSYPHVRQVTNKATPNVGQEHMATEIYGALPAAVKTIGHQRYVKKPQTSRHSTFVPIPELGIFTPDQHVLQNGTFAQHCQHREVNNNNNSNNQHRYFSSSLQQLDNVSSAATSTASNFSVNSSFDESASSLCLPAAKGVLQGFDTGCYSHTNYPSGDIYHSCIDLPLSQRTDQNLNVRHKLNMHNSDYKLEKSQNAVGKIAKHGGKPSYPVKRQDRGDNSKLDPGSRAHSLGDLSTGLTFSLVGQKKCESMQRVPAASTQNGAGYGSTHLHHGVSTSGKLHNRDAGFSNNMQVHPASNNIHVQSASNNSLDIQQDYGSSTTLCDPSAFDSHHHNPEHHHGGSNRNQNDIALLHNFHSHPPSRSHYKEFQRQHSQPNDQYGCQLQQPYKHSTPEQTRSTMGVTSLRTRKDSEDTTSSYKSAFSEVRSLSVEEDQNKNRTSISSHSTDDGRANIRFNQQANIIPAHKNSASLAETHSKGKTNSASSNSQPAASVAREQSPTKPRRSLPNVPPTETSERIKRFTEMMKSRMSLSSSSSRNCSADSSSSRQAPSRISSIESVCSVLAPSRKSSLKTPPSETPSDSEVFISASDNLHKGVIEHSKQNGFTTWNGVSQYKTQTSAGQGSHKQPQSFETNSSQTKMAKIHYGNHNMKDPNSPNRRKSVGDVYFQDAAPRGYYGLHNKDSYETMQGASRRNGQYIGSFPCEETPPPLGDHSTDSGTNHSYNGSALDSGYTTNNDGENDSYKSNSHHQRKQVTSVPAQHSVSRDNPTQFGRRSVKDIKEELLSFNQQSNKPVKKSSNLIRARQFGSAQNISSSGQVSGYSKNSYLFNDDRSFNKNRYPQSSSPVSLADKPDGSYLSKERATYQKVQNAMKKPIPLKNDVLNHLKESHKSSNRKSWDYADGFVSSQIKKYPVSTANGRTDERYRSYEVLPSSHSHIEEIRATQPSGTSDYKTQVQKQKVQNGSLAGSSQNISSRRLSGQLNTIKEFTPLMSHSFHGDLDLRVQPNESLYSEFQPSLVHKLNNSSSGASHPVSHSTEGIDESRSLHLYTNGFSSFSQPPENEVRPRPVPVSRANRSARGHTLPGGFRFNETEAPLSPGLAPSQDISLFHMTQQYDLSPLLMNLPLNVHLKDFIELEELPIEISVINVPALPISPRGKTPQIGTPGSAFTPVKHSVDQNKPLTAKIKVATFAHISDKLQKYTTLGRALEGDVVTEVNGWFCLGADFVYLRNVLDNSTGSVTFTVARLKENDEQRYKGQTALERIKGLESEISRLDDLIQARDNKIKSLTSAPTNSGHHRNSSGTLTEVNGRIPVEGMVIGGDEYVV